jgi:HPt (histidine-containing phosphotransfer) domain-containing protein
LRFTGVKQGLDLAETIEQNCSEGKEREQLPGLIEDLTRVCNQAIAELKSPLTS